jgi:hypothetical protein
MFIYKSANLLYYIICYLFYAKIVVNVAAIPHVVIRNLSTKVEYAVKANLGTARAFFIK